MNAPAPRWPARRATTTLLTAVLTLLLALALATGLAPSAAASPGGDRFWAGEVYRGEFGAPSVLKVGRTYYAYGTNTDGDMLPVMYSTDLVTWRARPAWPQTPGSWRGFNDAMRRPARWADVYRQGTRLKVGTWAPSVAVVGRTYVDAYAVSVNNATGRHCISVATAPHPMGPFIDRSTGPLVCSADPKGSIDPQLFQPGDGRTFLIWKNAGNPNAGEPTTIWTRQLDPSGTAFARGTRAHLLLATAERWEDNVIEAPAMIRFAGRYYLFYSGSGFLTDRYATGYAICSSPIGGCKRVTKQPLLATGNGIAGPGAGTPFLDGSGALRFAYSAWRAGHVGYQTDDSCHRQPGGCNQRRMYIATFTADARGRLHVAQLYNRRP